MDLFRSNWLAGLIIGSSCGVTCVGLANDSNDPVFRL